MSVTVAKVTKNQASISITHPGPYDVLCCKSSIAYDHIGNRRFRVLIDCHSESYASTGNNKSLKTQLVNSVIQAIKEGGGSFLVKKRKECSLLPAWETMSNRKVKEKVGHALRRNVAKMKKNKSIEFISNSEYAFTNPIHSSSSLPLSILGKKQLKQTNHNRRHFSVDDSLKQMVDKSLSEPMSIEDNVTTNRNFSSRWWRIIF